MTLYCLDLEGILIPEIWIAVSRRLGIKELALTTRDIPNYGTLMRHRLKVLDRKKIRLPQIQRVISRMRPLPGAKMFLKKLQAAGPVIILSDTFYEFAGPLMKQLDYPALFCNTLKVNRSGQIIGYKLRQTDGKRKAVLAFKKTGFRIKAVGDSYNDLAMLKTAHQGILFNPPAQIRKSHPRYPIAKSHKSLLSFFLKNP